MKNCSLLYTGLEQFGRELLLCCQYYYYSCCPSLRFLSKMPIICDDSACNQYVCLLPDPLLLTTHCPSYFKLLVSFSFATHWNQRGLHHCSIRTCRKIFHCSCKHYFSFLLSMPRDRDLNSNTVYSTADRLLHSTAL